jgi:hypothetical protein
VVEMVRASTALGSKDRFVELYLVSQCHHKTVMGRLGQLISDRLTLPRVF